MKNKLTGGRVEENKEGLVLEAREKKLTGSRSLKIEELEERKAPNVAWGE